MLNVVNGRPSAVAMNCQVLLKKVWRRMPTGEFGELPLPYPLTMSWPPSEFTPMTMTIRRDHTIDFGFVEKAFGCAEKAIADGFTPNARVIPNNFDGYVRAGDTVRYGFEIVSDSFVSPRMQVFEVSWNGQWSQDPDKMASNLQIREVTV